MNKICADGLDLIKELKIRKSSGSFERIFINIPPKEKDFLLLVEKSLPLYLKANIEIISDSIISVIVERGQTFSKDSEFSNPIEAVFASLDKGGFSLVKKEHLEDVRSSLENIENGFLTKIFKDTPYINTKELFYIKPISSWEISEIKSMVADIKKLTNDFKKIDDFLCISNDDEKSFARRFYNMQIGLDTQDYQSLCSAISDFEMTFRNAKLKYLEITNVGLNDLFSSLKYLRSDSYQKASNIAKRNLDSFNPLILKFEGCVTSNDEKDAYLVFSSLSEKYLAVSLVDFSFINITSLKYPCNFDEIVKLKSEVLHTLI
jgi:hypothetical protein